MYKRVKTDKTYVTENGSVSHPIATLADEYGGRAQIGIDDGCYLLYLKRERDDGSIFYRRTSWIFPEAHDLLKRLKDPKTENQLLSERLGNVKHIIDEDGIFEMP